MTSYPCRRSSLAMDLATLGSSSMCSTLMAPCVGSSDTLRLPKIPNTILAGSLAVTGSVIAALGIQRPSEPCDDTSGCIGPSLVYNPIPWLEGESHVTSRAQDGAQSPAGRETHTEQPILIFCCRSAVGESLVEQKTRFASSCTLRRSAGPIAGFGSINFLVSLGQITQPRVQSA